MGGIVMKCEELQIGDWIQNKNGDPMQIIKVGKGFVHTNIIDDDGFPMCSVTSTISQRVFH